MAKKQTRRAISINRDRYEASKAFADQLGVSLSRMTEHALDVFISLKRIGEAIE